MSTKPFLFGVLALAVIVALGCAWWSMRPIAPPVAVTTDPVPVATGTSTSTSVLKTRHLEDSALTLAKAGNADAYSFTTSHNAEIISLDKGNTYGVWWQPENFDPATSTIVVSLHGHGGWATQDFTVWYPNLAQRNYAYFGLQWWFGRSLENDGYYDIPEMYELIVTGLKEKGITSGNIVFQGFSMGGARSYGVALLDKQSANPLFDVSIANSGPWEDNYPMYADVLAGKYGEQPFAGTTWMLFCGDKDENEEVKTSYVHVCDGMDHTQDVLRQYGGTVAYFLKDPNGEHGSLMRLQSNFDAMFDEVDTYFK
jgi:pimeloyl-ACP methyl ester carboxylesterase